MKRILIAMALCATAILCATAVDKPADMITREPLPGVIELSGTDDVSMQRIYDSLQKLEKHIPWEIPDLGHYIAKQSFETQIDAVDQPGNLTNITENETDPEVANETEIINMDDIIYL